MLPCLGWLAIYAVGAAADRFIEHGHPWIIPTVLVIGVHALYGYASFTSRPEHWADKALTALSLVGYMHSVIYNWDLYRRILAASDQDLQLIIVLVLATTTAMAIGGPIRAALRILGRSSI